MNTEIEKLQQLYTAANQERIQLEARLAICHWFATVWFVIGGLIGFVLGAIALAVRIFIGD